MLPVHGVPSVSVHCPLWRDNCHRSIKAVQAVLRVTVHSHCHKSTECQLCERGNCNQSSECSVSVTAFQVYHCHLSSVQWVLSVSDIQLSWYIIVTCPVLSKMFDAQFLFCPMQCPCPFFKKSLSPVHSVLSASVHSLSPVQRSVNHLISIVYYSMLSFTVQMWPNLMSVKYIFPEISVHKIEL